MIKRGWLKEDDWQRIINRGWLTDDDWQRMVDRGWLTEDYKQRMIDRWWLTEDGGQRIICWIFSKNKEEINTKFWHFKIVFWNDPDILLFFPPFLAFFNHSQLYWELWILSGFWYPDILISWYPGILVSWYPDIQDTRIPGYQDTRIPGYQDQDTRIPE